MTFTPDPTTPHVLAPTQPDGGPPKEVVDQFLEDARALGCVCSPRVTIDKEKKRIALNHKAACPLLDKLRPQG